MKTYREKDVSTVQAEQWFPNEDGTTDHPHVVVKRFEAWVPKVKQMAVVFFYEFKPGYSAWRIEPGCWFVKDSMGDWSVYGPLSFADVYEPTEDTA